MNKLKSMMFDSLQLKLIGLAMTLIGAVGITFFSGAGQETIRLNLEFISYPAIAIFAYLVVEGHQKTENLRKYNIALLLCAIATEPFYDYACIGSWLDYGSANGQNFLFALLLCQFVILLLRTAEASENWKKLMIVSIFPAIPFWAMLSNVRFSGVAMLFTALFYLLRMKPRRRAELCDSMTKKRCAVLGLAALALCGVAGGLLMGGVVQRIVVLFANVGSLI